MGRNKLKIAICCSSSPTSHVGGISVYSKELSQALKIIGHSIIYICPKPEDYDWIEKWTDGHFWTNPCDNPIRTASKLLAYLNSSNIDGVINNDNPIAQSIAPALSCPFISVGHLDHFSIATLVTLNINYTDYVVCISSDMQLNFVRHHHVAPEKTVIILNGIADHRTDWTPADTERSDTTIRSIYSGGHNRRKGSRHILKLARRISPGREHVIRWIGPKPPNYMQEDHLPIKFIDGMARDDYLKELRSADVLLLPSRAEGCPMSLLEAMCNGMVPIVSDGIGAMRWIVDHGINGYVCPLKGWDKHAAQCLEHLSNNPSVLSELKKNSRQSFLQHFLCTLTYDFIQWIACNIFFWTCLEFERILNHRGILSFCVH